ncbi:ATP-binding protein [Paraglaciecola sp. Hal342]
MLLHALWRLQQAKKIPFTLSAIYIHHGLSENADLWQQHCADVCDALNIEFASAKGDTRFFKWQRG